MPVGPNEGRLFSHRRCRRVAQKADGGCSCIVDDAVVGGRLVNDCAGCGGVVQFWAVCVHTPLLYTMVEGLSDESVRIGPVMVVTKTNIEFDGEVLRRYQPLDTLNCRFDIDQSSCVTYGYSEMGSMFGGS